LLADLDKQREEHVSSKNFLHSKVQTFDTTLEAAKIVRIRGLKQDGGELFMKDFCKY